MKYFLKNFLFSKAEFYFSIFLKYKSKLSTYVT